MRLLIVTALSATALLAQGGGGVQSATLRRRY